MTIIDYRLSTDLFHLHSQQTIMANFKFPEKLADHLENEIYNKLVVQVQTKIDSYNKLWAEREQQGRTYDTHKVYKARSGNVVEEKVYYYKLSEFITVTFHQEEDSWDNKMRNDYYRPLSCVINLDACKDNAHAQRVHSVALCTERVNNHLAETDHGIYETLKLGSQNLIEGFVYGVTKDNENFQIKLQMMWNYRYGENSANGYLTQYVQYRSDRRGAKQEGKSVQQAIKDAEKQARRDEKLAIQNEKQMAKWEKFSTLPVVMEKWVDKEIKRLAAYISDEGLADSQRTADRMGYTFDKEWQIKCISGDIDKHNALRNDLRHWQNDETGLKALFDRGVDTRNKLKEVYGV